MSGVSVCQGSGADLSVTGRSITLLRQVSHDGQSGAAESKQSVRAMSSWEFEKGVPGETPCVVPKRGSLETWSGLGLQVKAHSTSSPCHVWPGIRPGVEEPISSTKGASQKPPHVASNELLPVLPRVPECFGIGRGSCVTEQSVMPSHKVLPESQPSLGRPAVSVGVLPSPEFENGMSMRAPVAVRKDGSLQKDHVQECHGSGLGPQVAAHSTSFPRPVWPGFRRARCLNQGCITKALSRHSRGASVGIDS